MILGLCLLLANLSGCGVPVNKADCDELLNQQQWQKVLDDCQKPSDRASAYLGLAGFSLTALLNSSNGAVIPILGLTPGNIDQARQYLELAVEAVSPPEDGSDAFALLLASYLGLGTLTEEYLDLNFDGTISTSEINTVIPYAADPTPFLYPLTPGSLQISALVDGSPYILVCTAADSPNICGVSGSTQVYNDPDGSGRLTPAVTGAGQSASKATVITDIATATNAGMIIQLAALGPPVTFTPSVSQSVTNFLGPAGQTGTFAIGMAGYLQAITVANNVLIASGGQPGGSTITTDITTQVNNFDNGAKSSCVLTATAPLNITMGGLPAYLNAFASTYDNAAGTPLNPVPSGASATYFQNWNLVSTSIRSAINTFNTTPPLALPTLPDPSTSGTYAFSGGKVSQYKFIYATAAGLVAFDATQATPRIDQAYAAFVSEADSIPIFGPNAANDGYMTFMELLCEGQ